MTGVVAYNVSCSTGTLERSVTDNRGPLVIDVSSYAHTVKFEPIALPIAFPLHYPGTCGRLPPSVSLHYLPTCHYCLFAFAALVVLLFYVLGYVPTTPLFHLPPTCLRGDTFWSNGDAVEHFYILRGGRSATITHLS